MSDAPSHRPRKAMILAAGHGNRLRPLTAYRAKPALPLLGRPLISYIVSSLSRWGIENLVVNISHGADDLERLLESVADECALKLSLSRETEPLGTAGGLAKASDLIRSFPGETLLLVNGDTLARFDLDALVQSFNPDDVEASVLLKPRHSGSSHTSISASVGRVSGVGDPAGAHMFAGVWLLGESALERLSGRSVGLEVDLLPRLVSDGCLAASVQELDWITIDTPRRYLDGSREVLRTRLFSEQWPLSPIQELGEMQDIEVGNARVVIGERTRVDPGASFRGEVIIGHDCHVGRGAEIHNSVLWNGVHVGEGAVVRSSIMTDGSRLDPNTRLTDEIVMQADEGIDRFRAAELTRGVVRTPMRR